MCVREAGWAGGCGHSVAVQLAAVAAGCGGLEALPAAGLICTLVRGSPALWGGGML